MNKYHKFKHEHPFDRILKECLKTYEKQHENMDKYCENFWFEYSMKISANTSEVDMLSMILTIDDIN